MRKRARLDLTKIDVAREKGKPDNKPLDIGSIISYLREGTTFAMRICFD